MQGNLFNAPSVDARRSALNTNDLRGKVNRIKVNADGSYSIPSGNLFAPGTAKTRPEIYAMGFRNPFRIQVDDAGVAYVTDYSPDSQTPQQFRGPAGTGRVEVVRKPANYGWPLCYSPDLPYYRWNFLTSTPLDSPAQAHECDNPNRGPLNDSRWNLEGGPTVEAGPGVQPTDHQAGHLVLLPGQRRHARSATPASRPTGRLLRPPAPSSPRSCSTVAWVRTARRRTTTTPTTRARRSSRRTTTARSSSVSSPATTCGRSAWTRRATS